MKIYEKDINNLTNKIILTNNIFKLLNNIEQQNKKVILITPWTKITDLLLLKKDSALINLMHEIEPNFKNKLLNETYIIAFFKKLVNVIKVDGLELNTDYEKIFKLIVEINQRNIKEEEINLILAFLSKYSSNNIDVVIAGFEKLKVLKTYPYINLIFLTNNIIGKINMSMIEALVINNSKEIFEIEDIEAFVAWLEVKTKTVLTYKDLDNYLKGIENFNSFLIDRALKKL